MGRTPRCRNTWSKLDSRPLYSLGARIRPNKQRRAGMRENGERERAIENNPHGFWHRFGRATRRHIEDGNSKGSDFGIRPNHTQRLFSRQISSKRSYLQKEEVPLPQHILPSSDHPQLVQDLLKELPHQICQGQMRSQLSFGRDYLPQQTHSKQKVPAGHISQKDMRCWCLQYFPAKSQFLQLQVLQSFLYTSFPEHV